VKVGNADAGEIPTLFKKLLSGGEEAISVNEFLAAHHLFPKRDIWY
jgi:hypothetical protein